MCSENFLRFCSILMALLLLFLGFHKSSDQLGMVQRKVLLESQDVQPPTVAVTGPVAGYVGTTSLKCSTLQNNSANRGLSLEPSLGTFADMCPLDTLASCASGLPLVTSVALVPFNALSVCNSVVQPKLTCTSEPTCLPNCSRAFAVSLSTSSPGAISVSGSAIPESSRLSLKRCADENKNNFDMHFKKKLLHTEHQLDLQRWPDSGSRTQAETSGTTSSSAKSSIISSCQPISMTMEDNKRTVSPGAAVTDGVLRYTISSGTSQHHLSSNSGQVLRAALLGGRPEGNVLQAVGLSCSTATANLHAPAPNSAVPIFIHHKLANGQPPSIRAGSQSFGTQTVFHSPKFQVNQQPPASQTVAHSQRVQLNVQPPTVQLGTIPISSSARPVIFCSLPQNLSVNSGCPSQKVFPNLMPFPHSHSNVGSDPTAVSQASICNAVPLMSQNGERNLLGQASQQLLKARLQRDAPHGATRYVLRLASSLAPMLCPSARLLATSAIGFARPTTYGPTASLGSPMQNFTSILVQGSVNRTLGSSTLARIPSDTGSFSSGIGTAASGSPDPSSQDEHKSPSSQDRCNSPGKAT